MIAKRKKSAKKPAKLRGNRQPLAVTLPPELIAAVDEMAHRQERSRAKMVEILLRGAVQWPQEAA